MKLIAEFKYNCNYIINKTAFLFHQEQMGRTFLINEKSFHIKLPNIYFVLIGHFTKDEERLGYYDSYLFGSVDRVEKLYDLVFPMPLPHVYDDGGVCLSHGDPIRFYSKDQLIEWGLNSLFFGKNTKIYICDDMVQFICKYPIKDDSVILQEIARQSPGLWKKIPPATKLGKCIDFCSENVILNY